jgi:hypothetical protein
MKKIIISKPNILDRISDDIVLLSSYPRSGNTWTLFLLQDILSQNREESCKFQNNYTRGTCLYDIHAEENLERKMSDTSFSGILKIHYIDSQLKNKIIYIYRKPLDIIPSYLRFHKYQGYDGYAKPYSYYAINLFLKEILSHWRIALQIYQKHNKNIIFIPYEGLHSRPEILLQICCEFIELKNIPIKTINFAVENNKFQVMKNKSNFSEIHNDEVFLKFGKVDAGKGELSFFQKTWINLNSNVLYSKMINITKQQVSMRGNIS